MNDEGIAADRWRAVAGANGAGPGDRWTRGGPTIQEPGFWGGVVATRSEELRPTSRDRRRARMRTASNRQTQKQQGKAQGLRIVYNRRINGRFSTAAGYSFGTGQELAAEGITDPANLFRKDLFQSFFGQFEADVLSGTNVKTIFRFSPEATVFAIDPFQGRLAIYDPSLSVLVTQSLPTLGLPFHSEAVVDARNLFGFATGVTGEDGTLRLNSQRRALRGGILVRF